MKKLLIALLLIPTLSVAATQSEMTYSAVGFFHGCFESLSFRILQKRHIADKDWIVTTNECYKNMEALSTYRHLDDQSKSYVKATIDRITTDAMKGN